MPASAMEVDENVAVEIKKTVPQRKRVLCETPGSIVFTGDSVKGETVVVKKIKITDSDCFDRFDQELAIMKQLKCKNIIKPLAVCETAPNYAYILPWKPHGSMYELMHLRLVPVQKDFKLVVLFCLDLARAIENMHNSGVIHRDIKPHNLLLGNDGVATLTDFGLAEYEKKLLDEGDAIKRPTRPSAGFKKIMGTFEYMAPELFLRKNHTRACDIYALGVSMNELYTGHLPYMGAEKDTENFYTVVDTRYDRLSLMKAICKDDLRPDITPPHSNSPSDCEKELFSLMKKCWAPEAKDRPTASEAVKVLEGLVSKVNAKDKERKLMLDTAIKNAPKIEAPKQYIKPRTEALPELKFDEEKKKEEANSSNLPPPPSIRGGVISTMGKRGYMEDYHIVKHNLFGNKDLHLFGVYDGHGGDGAAKFVSSALPELLKPIQEKKDPKAVLKQAHYLLNQEFLKSAEFAEDVSGTTACTVLISGRKMYVANAGDSMAVLCRGTEAIALNKMHLASDEKEREDIESRGGFVKLTKDGKLRTGGVVQVSRAIGDRKIAKYLTSEPEIYEYLLKPGDEFLVVATDGLWDVLSPQRTVDILNNTVKHADYGSKSIVGDALQLGSDDNITAIVAYISEKKGDGESDKQIVHATDSVNKRMGTDEAAMYAFESQNRAAAYTMADSW